ncbi:MAG TPA: DNA-binding response regulator, partial [Clostridiales bacterium]|nr:DNA-binding response regulator [Clostridiales bacterium]
AVELIRGDVPDIVLTDIRMPKMDGIELIEYLKANYPQVKIIIISGYSDV